MENIGTMMNCVHHGKGWRYQGKYGGRKHPFWMSCRTMDDGVDGVNVNVPALASFCGRDAPGSAV